MKKIESFLVDHTCLRAGLYLSRRDSNCGVAVSTFDIRVTCPNVEPVMDVPAIHTMEHIGATYLRNSSVTNDIIYFGPMGCRTGFYLVMFGELISAEVLPLVTDMFNFIANFNGEIPGADARSCGNYQEQNLSMARYYANKYLSSMVAECNLVYPAVD